MHCTTLGKQPCDTRPPLPARHCRAVLQPHFGFKPSQNVLLMASVSRVLLIAAYVIGTYVQATPPVYLALTAVLGLTNG